MFICEDCGASFIRPCQAMEYWGECHGRPQYSQRECCPFCGGPFHGNMNDEDEDIPNI